MVTEKRGKLRTLRSREGGSAGTGRPGEWGGVGQPNPEIRDDSYLNNVGGMSSVQPREEANSAEGAPDRNPAGDKSQLGRSIWNRKATEATKILL